MTLTTSENPLVIHRTHEVVDNDQDLEPWLIPEQEWVIIPLEPEPEDE
jgi:hypothetical protein